jgi:hypothetical protein
LSVRLSEVIRPLRRREYLNLAGIPRIRPSTESAEIGSRSSASILTISVRLHQCHTSIASAGGRRARRRRPIEPGAGAALKLRAFLSFPDRAANSSGAARAGGCRRGQSIAHEPGDHARAAADRHRATDHMTA